MQDRYPFKLYRVAISRITNKPSLILIDSSSTRNRLLNNLDAIKATNPENHYIVVEVTHTVLAEYIPIAAEVTASKNAELDSITEEGADEAS